MIAFSQTISRIDLFGFLKYFLCRKVSHLKSQWAGLLGKHHLQSNSEGESATIGGHRAAAAGGSDRREEGGSP